MSYEQEIDEEANILEDPVKLSGKDITLSIPHLLDFPECGLVTFKYERGQLILKSATRSEEASATATLHLKEVCSVCECEYEKDEEPEEEGDSSRLDKLFASVGPQEEEEDEA